MWWPAWGKPSPALWIPCRHSDKTLVNGLKPPQGGMNLDPTWTHTILLSIPEKNQPTNQPINKPRSLGLYSKREFASQSMFRGLGCKLGFRRHRWRDQGHLALTEEILAEYVGCIQRSEMVLVEKDKLCGPRWHNQESRLNGVEFG